MSFQIVDGGVTSAKGFSAAHTAAGIKYKDRDDMALLYCEADCASAGTYTSNVVKAAPVLWDRAITSEDIPVRAVVINAGIANACTGREGLDACRQEAESAGEVLNIPADSVLVASTGVIGMDLPTDKIKAALPALSGGLGSSREDAHAAACAIMTTDTKPKEACATVEIDGATVTIGGMCKGSGMIHPNMCTMLSFVTTDVCIDKTLLQEALSASVRDSYNMISVDGDTSTNDTCIVLASGLAGNVKITDRESPAYQAFSEALAAVNLALAKQMAGDGEGCTALLEVHVQNAATEEDARTLAKSVVTSSLTKAAIYGHDANWGRILCALGYSGVNFDPEAVDITFESENGRVEVVKCGRGTGYSEELATKVLSAEAVQVYCDMKQGDVSATAYGCDLTHEYVTINADYRS